MKYSAGNRRQKLSHSLGYIILALEVVCAGGPRVADLNITLSPRQEGGRKVERVSEISMMEPDGGWKHSRSFCLLPLG